MEQVAKTGEDRLLKAKDVAKILGISVRGVWRHSKNGVIPSPVHVGVAARWRMSDVLKYIAMLET